MKNNNPGEIELDTLWVTPDEQKWGPYPQSGRYPHNNSHHSFPNGSLHRRRRLNDYNPGVFGHSIFEHLDNLADAVPNEETGNPELDEKLKSDTKLLAEVVSGIAKKYGDETGEAANKLIRGIKGKKILNYRDALVGIEKLKNTRYPTFSVSSSDKNAISDAIRALDKRTLADNFNRLSVASGLLAKGFTAEVFYSKIEGGFRTGNWKPLVLEIEAMALSGVAAAAMTRLIPYALLSIAVIFPALSLTVAYGILFFGAVFLASLIDTKLVDMFNTELENYIDAVRTDY